MKAKLVSRLNELQQEYDKGEEQLAALDLQAGNLKKTLLRISGAIQVITELLEQKEIINTTALHNGAEAEASNKKVS